MALALEVAVLHCMMTGMKSLVSSRSVVLLNKRNIYIAIEKPQSGCMGNVPKAAIPARAIRVPVQNSPDRF